MRPPAQFGQVTSEETGMDIKELIKDVDSSVASDAYGKKAQEALTLVEHGLDGEAVYGPEFKDAKHRLDILYEAGKEKLTHAFVRPFYSAFQKELPERDAVDEATWHAAGEVYAKRCKTLDPVYYDTGTLSAVGSLHKKLLKVDPQYQNEAYQKLVSFTEAWEPVGRMLKELKPNVIKGKRPAEKTEEQTRQEALAEAHKRTCPCCLGRFETRKNGAMVLHGYKRPGTGETVGQCIGYAKNFRPLEDSLDGAYYMYLRARKQEQEAELRKLKLENGKVDEIFYQTYDARKGKRISHVATPEDENWADLVKKEIDRTAYVRAEAQQSQIFYAGVLRDNLNLTYPKDDIGKAVEREKYMDIIKNRLPDELAIQQERQNHHQAKE